MVSSLGARAWFWLTATSVWLAGGLASFAGAQAARPDASALSIEAPTRLSLSEQRAVTVRYHARMHLGATLHVSAGTLGAPRQIGDGLWEVVYTPPKARFPQVAIWALVSRDGAHYSWNQTALFGAATVELSSDPNVQVSVNVAGEVFGPVETDAQGRARIPVVVPPGVKDAVSSATDALGNVRTQNVPLDVPRISPLLCVGPRESTQGFLVFATDARGAPAPHAQLKTAAKVVTLTQTSAPEAGVYRVGFGLPEQPRPGSIAHLDVSLDPADAAVSCEIPLALEAAAGVDVSLSRQSFVATDDEPITIRLVPRYSGTGERASAVVSLAASLGELSQASVATREPTEVVWRLPHTLAGQTHAQLQVRGDVTKDFSVPLAGGAPAELRAKFDNNALPADGVATTRLRVLALDVHGNAAPIGQLEAEARGSLTAFRATAPGSYETEYRAPLGHGGVDKIRVFERASGLSAAPELVLRDAPSRFSLAARAGFLTNFAHVHAPLGVLQLGYRPPWLDERLRVSLLAGYYQSQASVSTSGEVQELDVAVWALPLMLRGAYAFRFGALEVAPVLGMGMLGAQSRVASAESGSFLDAHFVLLWAAGAGASWPLGPGRICGELAYWAASLEKAAITGNAGGANLSLGYEVLL